MLLTHSTMSDSKPIIGFTCGDVNGIGIELIIKTLSDARITEHCTPVIFASNKVINFYRKSVQDGSFNFQPVKELQRLNPKAVNLFNCWEEEVNITPGELNDIGGKYAVLSLKAAVVALREGHIHGLVTAPIHKKNVQSQDFPYTGHTPFLKDALAAKEVLMLMTASNLRVGLVTEHVPVGEVSKHITKEGIVKKLVLLKQSLKRDFGIDKPKIAVLALNPHAGDEGLIGKEELEIIQPAIKDVKQQDMIAWGPYPADAFFARGQHEKFDAVLAMYHDQGLIPFKSLAVGEGTNFTAGLSAVRTSPDHGTAFDIAGKGKADEASFRAALYTCIDIIRSRQFFDEGRANPLRKMSGALLARAVDEKIEE